ncbi:MAG: NosD domain-containing protein [Candidatus Hodarchaeota archaeon]
MGFLNIFDIYKDSYLISQEISTSAPHAVIFVNGNSGPSGLDTFPDTTGNGTEINPYIIENFEINGSGAGTCIEIRNTDKYLVIKNCTIENSGTGSLDSGIYLSNCTNVVIRNNTINNCRNGIYLYSGTQNCTIEKNILFDHVDGLKIEDSINNKIFRNVIENNSQYGIYLTGTSNNNRIVINSLSGNEYSQAYTDTSGIGNYWSNSILGNFWGDYQSRYPSASQVGAVWDIPYLINGSLNQYDEHPLINFIGVHAPIILEGNSEVDAFFAGNGTNGNSWLSAHVLDGFKIIAGEFSNCIEIKNTDRYLVISNNYVTGAAGYWENAGIKLQNCSNINISSNVAANNSIGIYIHQSSNTNVSSNNASSNIGDGFFIYYSNYINLSGNKGIGNLQDGIEIRSSHNNTLDSSVFLGNGQNGINIDDGDDNTIISNNVLNNKQGILINYASFNNVSINNITRNTINGIHLISNSDNNTIFNNSIEDCVYGIEIVDSRFTTLLNNTLLNCGVGVSGTINQVGTHVMDTSNLVNSNILYYYANQTNLSSSNFTNGSQVILANCTNSFLSDINANNVTDGVLLLYSNFTVITASNFSNNAHSGINATYGVGNNISFNNFSHNTESIALHYEMNAMVHNNVMNDSYIAVSVTAGSYNHTFYENKMVNGGFYIAGNVASASTLDINTTNKVNGKPVYYYYNQVSLDSSNFSNPGQIMLINCNHSSLSNVKIFNATSGIVLRYCYNFSLSGIECQSNSISGFTFSKVFNSSFVDCNVTQNENGILLGASEENVFSGMNITANDDTGIRLINSNYNNFTNCLIQHNRYGYRAAGIFQSSDYNKLHESNISYNREYGIWLDESEGKPGQEALSGARWQMYLLLWDAHI